MKHAIIMIMLLSSASLAASESFLLDMNIHKDESVELNEFRVLYEEPYEYLPEGDYAFRIYSGSRLLYEARYQVIFSIRGHGVDENGNPTTVQGETDYVPVRLKLPFFADAERIELRHNDRLIYVLDVKSYLCNSNGMCDNAEGEDTCPGDCAAAALGTGASGISTAQAIGIALFVLSVVLSGAYFYKRRA